MKGRQGSLGGRRLIARADASTGSGTGHFMRVFALAQAWLARGGRVLWLVADAPGALIARSQAEGVAMQRLETEAGSTDDAREVRQVLLADPFAMGVIDGEQFGTDYLAVVGEVGERILLIDDLAARNAYPVGYVLNQNLHATREAYPAAATCQFLLGSLYVLLRREFIADPGRKPTPARAGRLIVTFGGADPLGVTGQIIEAIKRLPPVTRESLETRIVVGSANVDAERITTLVADDPGFHARVLSSVRDMRAEFQSADLAITSGGSTVWELARMGCPALVVETGPAETLLVSGLRRAGLFASLGHASGLETRVVADEIAAKIEDGRWRKRMSRLGQRLVDGHGAARVIAAMTVEASGQGDERVA